MKRLLLLACILCAVFSVSCNSISDILGSGYDKIYPDSDGVYRFSIDQVEFSYSPATITFAVYNPTSYSVRVNIKRDDEYVETRPGATETVRGGHHWSFRDAYYCNDAVRISVTRDRVESICYIQFK